MKTVAIIPAGGSGSRMGGDLRKQYLPIGDVPIIVHTLKAFQETGKVDEIFLILPAEQVVDAKRTIVEKGNLWKVTKILPGGTRRQDSVKNGLDALDEFCEVVIVHDGVRPFITRDLIEKVIAEAFSEGAVAVGIPVKDTVKVVDPRGFVKKTLLRDTLWLTQTPQAFRTALIKEAYQRSYRENYFGTDDATLVERLGVRVKMLMGSEENIKITTALDMKVGEMLFMMQQKRNIQRVPPVVQHLEEGAGK